MTAEFGAFGAISYARSVRSAHPAPASIVRVSHAVPSDRTGGINVAGNCKLAERSSRIELHGGAGSNASVGHSSQTEMIESPDRATQFDQHGKLRSQRRAVRQRRSHQALAYRALVERQPVGDNDLKIC
jgi:hypothetical protein